MQPAPFLQIFFAGEPVPQTGIYLISHGKGHQASKERLLPTGIEFPRCPKCGMEVRFTLVRAAPRIWEDKDFAA
jgi:hypothetical protein